LDGHRLAFAGTSSIWLEAIFWITQCVMLLIGRDPNLFKKYSITKSHVTYPSPKLIQTALFETIQGHLLRPFLLWLIYPIYKKQGCFNTAIPSFPTLLTHMCFCILIDDTLFYWSHRLLHENRWLYQNIHKQHHEFKYSVGLAVEYAHPVEDLLSNTLPTIAGALFLGSHASIAIGYMGMKVWQSIDAHSGFDLSFPLSPWNVFYGMDCASAHDFHHSHNVGNYGGFFSFWDSVCGTNKAYKKYLIKKDRNTKT